MAVVWLRYPEAAGTSTVAVAKQQHANRHEHPSTLLESVGIDKSHTAALLLCIRMSNTLYTGQDRDVPTRMTSSLPVACHTTSIVDASNTGRST